MKDLAKLINEQGKITIAALDHRGSLKASLNPANPEVVTDEEIMAWKKRMVELYKTLVSGILIDPIYGKGIVNPSDPWGWMLSMEKTGYRGGKQARVTEILPDWSVAKAREMGACSVKLLLYYDPENKELAKKQKELAQKLGEECEREGMVYLLEPLSYKVEGKREEEVVRIAEDLQDVSVDIWKFEYPGTEAGCKRITEIVAKPWVLLSAGTTYEQYREELRVAMSAGAQGFAVGRAVWQEFGEYLGEAREQYLTEVALPRMQELVRIVNNA